jgi:hypothetical protein
MIGGGGISARLQQGGGKALYAGEAPATLTGFPFHMYRKCTAVLMLERELMNLRCEFDVADLEATERRAAGHGSES